jgi:hypothetical protein
MCPVCGKMWTTLKKDDALIRYAYCSIGCANLGISIKNSGEPPKQQELKCEEDCEEIPDFILNPDFLEIV